MKRLAAVLLSVSLVCALCFLGGIGAAAGNAPGFATTSDVPTVTGDLLNPAFFAHGAYVMQGVNDPAKVFALPLLGVPELSFFPTASGIDPSTVTWRLEVSHPDGIGAEIRNDTLCIWGNSSTWSGYGTVTLTGTAGDASGSATIPVTVFRTDKTLINPEGKKDYFVPWSPQLDINRILSVEEHMQKYSKDEDSLDRTIRWSRWVDLRFMRGVNAGGGWLNSTLSSGWTTALQYATVDVALEELAALHVQWVKLDPHYYMFGLQSNEIVSSSTISPPTWTAEDVAYVVNEAHRRGIRVIGSFQVRTLTENGNWDASISRQLMHPSDWHLWLANYEKLASGLATLQAQLGTDMICPGVELENLYKDARGRSYIAESDWNSSMLDVVSEVRAIYPGPVTWALAPTPTSAGPAMTFSSARPLARALDVVGLNAWFLPLCTMNSPTAADMRSAWEGVVARVVDPFVEGLGKPYILAECGGPSAQGALCHPGYADAHTDLDVQAITYRSIVDAFFSRPGFFGAFWWQWSVAAGCADTAGGAADNGYAFRLKPSQDIIEAAYGDGTIAPRIAHIDGNVADWRDAWLLASDAIGDRAAATGPDIDSLYAVRDSHSLYLRVSFAQPLAATSLGYMLFFLDVNQDAVVDYKIAVGLVDATTSWLGAAIQPPFQAGVPSVGFGDAAFSGRDVEVSVPLAFLGATRGSIAVSFACHVVRDGSLIWIDSLGFDRGVFYGPVVSGAP